MKLSNSPRCRSIRSIDDPLVDPPAHSDPPFGLLHCARLLIGNGVSLCIDFFDQVLNLLINAIHITQAGFRLAFDLSN